MVEQTSAFLKVSPAIEDPAFSVSGFVSIDPYDATVFNQGLLKIEPLPGVSAGLGLSPPPDAGGAIPTALPSKSWIVVRFEGKDHYVGEMSKDSLAKIDMAIAGLAWSFGLPARVGDNGRPWTSWESDLQGLAPPGIAEIDVLAVYEFGVGADAQLVEIPLITGARSWRSNRPLVDNPLLLSGKGRLSRYAKPKVVYLQKAGHGLSHGRLAKEILELTDLTASQIAIDTNVGEPLEKRLEVDCQPAPEAAAAVLESYGFRLIETRNGQMIAKHAAPVHLEPAATLKAEFVVAPETEVGTDWEDIPQCLIVEGDRPENPGAESDGWVTASRIESETEETITLPQATFIQQVTGQFTAVTGPGAFPQLLITERIIVRETFFQGCLCVTERFIWQFHTKETWRFQAASPGTLTGLPYSAYNIGAFSFEETQPTKDDSSLVFEWIRPRFVVVNYERTEHRRDSGLALDDSGDPDPQQPIGKEGRLARILNGLGRWRFQEVALRFATGGAPADWTIEVVIPNTLLRGNGQPVDGEEQFYGGPQVPLTGTHVKQTLNNPTFLGGEPYINIWAEFIDTSISLLDVETPTSEDRPGGWETGRKETKSGWERSDGNEFQYLNGETSADGEIQGRPILTTRRSFIAQGGGTHTEITSPTDGEGRPQPTISRFGLPSHLPNADICNAESVLEEKSVTVKGFACLPVGLVDPPWNDTIRFDFGVETAAQADRVAEIELRRRSANEVKIVMPFNALLEVLDPIRVEAADLGIDPDALGHKSNCWIENVKHDEEQDASSGAPQRRTELLLSQAII